MVELNEKAVTDAVETWIAADPETRFFDTDDLECLRRAITAYLSALPAPDDGLVARLRYRVENPSAWDSFDQGGSDLCREAAIALQSKDEQIERLTRERDEALADPYKVMGGIYEKWKARAEAADQQVQKLTADIERLREAVEVSRQVLAKLLSAGHNNPPATPEEIDAAFWSVDAALETQEGGK